MPVVETSSLGSGSRGRCWRRWTDRIGDEAETSLVGGGNGGADGDSRVIPGRVEVGALVGSMEQRRRQRAGEKISVHWNGFHRRATLGLIEVVGG